MAKNMRKPAKKKPRLKHVVCKPCWELKYRPYGPLVEYFPLVSDGLPLSRVRKSHAIWLADVRAGTLKSRQDIYRAIEGLLCLEPKRWAWIEQFQTDELRCSIFGHICPVFFSAEPFTETREDRRVTRTIPREVMLKVVRRDGQVCRVCSQNVPDNDIEFDHVIPRSRGGPSTPENLRVCAGPAIARSGTRFARSWRRIHFEANSRPNMRRSRRAQLVQSWR